MTTVIDSDVHFSYFQGLSAGFVSFCGA